MTVTYEGVKHTPDYVLHFLGLPTLLEILGLKRNRKAPRLADMDWMTTWRMATEALEVLHQAARSPGHSLSIEEIDKAIDRVRGIQHIATMLVEYEVLQ